MFKKTITYTDYNGVERTEYFYFNLNKAEVIEMETAETGGYAEMIQRVVSSKDGAAIMKVFKTFILKSYGVKSADGKRFEKSEEIAKAFEQSEAYSELFTELCTNAEEAARFVAAILPLDNSQKQEILKKADTTQIPATT